MLIVNKQFVTSNCKKGNGKLDIKDFKTVILTDSETKIINNKISDTVKDIEKIEQHL